MDALLSIVMLCAFAVSAWILLSPFPRRTQRAGADKIAELEARVRVVKGLPVLCATMVIATVSAMAILSGCAVAKPQVAPRAWTAPRIDRPLDDAEADSVVAMSQRSNAPAPALAAEFRVTHPRIQRHVARFESDGCSSLRTVLLRSRRYVPGMAAILRQAGLPPELAYLPLIESGFRPHAVSRAGAVGPWQLLAGTGRRYGLRIDRSLDERRDPLKSTQAAAKYLTDLHHMFGDWHLALAAYNVGEHAIARLLAAHPGATFWELTEQRRLNAETADFVPKFLAVLQIALQAESHAFDVEGETPCRMTS